MISLKDKVVIVTGGSRGIGKAIVLKVAEAGANIVFTYARSEEAALEVSNTVESLGVKCKAIKADATNYSEAENVISTAVELFGKVDCLVNNAGITQDNLLMRMSEDQWDNVIHTNLKSVFNYSKAVTRPMMRKRNGSIINISSIIGITGNAGQSNYAASKAGMIGFTKSLAKEIASRNIRVNAIAPGYIKTDMTEKLDEKTLASIVGAVPLGKPGDVESIANTVLFLCSDLSDYITGEVIKVDGGMAI